MGGINQVTVRPEIGLTFASSLRAILRQDPNIIMIGEIRDYDTVDIAIKSALTGHLVISTLHTTTAPGAIVRLMNMGVEPYLIDSSLICSMSQRLVRRVCSYCKSPVEIKKGLLDTMKIRLPEGAKSEFFKGKGCHQCLNTGYSGRICLAEVLMLTPKVRELILQRGQEHVVKQVARSEGMVTLRENGVDLALKGITTIDEILRVTAPDE